jgi:hypothetical protein
VGGARAAREPDREHGKGGCLDLRTEGPPSPAVPPSPDVASPEQVSQLKPLSTEFGPLESHSLQGWQYGLVCPAGQLCPLKHSTAQNRPLSQSLFTVHTEPSEPNALPPFPQLQQTVSASK